MRYANGEPSSGRVGSPKRFSVSQIHLILSMEYGTGSVVPESMIDRFRAAYSSRRAGSARSAFCESSLDFHLVAVGLNDVNMDSELLVVVLHRIQQERSFGRGSPRLLEAQRLQAVGRRRDLRELGKEACGPRSPYL